MLTHAASFEARVQDRMSYGWTRDESEYLVKRAAIEHEVSEKYRHRYTSENGGKLAKKENAELKADSLLLVNRLEQEGVRLTAALAELKAWTDQEPVAYMYDWIDGNPLGECSIIKDWIDTVAKEPTAFNMRPLYAKPKDTK